jgi:hypothetical protein
MEHSLHQPISTRSIVIPLAAALLGAGVATSTYALVDSGQASQPTVLVDHAASVDSQAQPTPTSGRRP